LGVTTTEVAFLEDVKIPMKPAGVIQAETVVSSNNGGGCGGIKTRVRMNHGYKRTSMGDIIGVTAGSTGKKGNSIHLI
jgi:hypothetical protein